MACLACEKYQKQIRNVYRDKELKKKYEKLVGYEVVIDCFICNNCHTKLLEAFKFQQNCIRVYKKNNPNHQQSTKLANSQTSEIGNKEEECYILQANDEVFTNEEQTDHQSILIGDPFSVYELNDECKEIQFEDEESQSYSKTETNDLKECINIKIEKPMTEIENSLMNEDILSLAIADARRDLKRENESLYENLSCKRPRKSYTAQQKLKIIKFAEENSNREAARKFSLNESTVRFFRRQKVDPKSKKGYVFRPYTVHQKLEIIEYAEEHSNREAARKFSLNESTVRHFRRQKSSKE